MNSPQFRRVKETFLRVVACPPDERKGRLARECRGDEQLLAEVSSLLASHRDDPDFLAEPALGRDFSVAAALADPFALQAGPYRPTALIGAGSVGIVYRAVHRSTGQEVALKVLRSSRAVAGAAARLEREARTLGRLQYPGIARLLGAGTATMQGESTVYIAMELVRGPMLTHYVAEQRASDRDKLSLLARIADAVQHAHDHGVVHNDLKPGNILVDDDGQPHIVDFGVAEIVDAAGCSSAGGHVSLGTPGYVAPERLANVPEPVRPAGDVYALGAIAYELLSGRSPIDRSATGTSRLRPDAWPLGAVRPELRGDLDRIVHHALEPDPRRRCPSAAFFAAELRRFVAGAPVRSPGPGTIRSLCRFAQRNRALVTVVAALLLALASGFAGMAAALAEAHSARAAEQEQRQLAEHGLETARIERARATAQLRRAEALSDFLTGLFRSAARQPGGERQGLVSLLAAAAAGLPTALDRDDPVRSETCAALGIALLAAGRYDLAEQQLQRAADLAQDDPEVTAQQRLTLLVDLGIARLRNGNPVRAALLLEQTAARLAADASSPADRLHQCRYYQALACFEAGRLDEAHAIASGLLQCGESRADDRLRLAAQSLQGRIASTRGHHALAATLYEDCLTMAETMLDGDRPQLWTLQNDLALEYLQLGRIDRCEELMQLALHGRRDGFGDDHPQTLQSRHNLASLRQHQGRIGEAIALHRDVLERRSRVLGDDHPATMTTRNNLARLLDRSGQPDAAEAIYRELVAQADPALHWQAHVFRRNLAELLQRRGRPHEALALAEQCLPGLESVYGTQHWRVRDVRDRIDALRRELAATSGTGPPAPEAAGIDAGR